MSTLLLFADTQRSAALRHEVPITIIDPLLWAEVNGRPVILTSRLERERIGATLPEAEILDFFDFGMKELREQGMPVRHVHDPIRKSPVVIAHCNRVGQDACGDRSRR